jgi:hypothetical protein
MFEKVSKLRNSSRSLGVEFTRESLANKNTYLHEYFINLEMLPRRVYWDQENIFNE